MSGSKHLVIFSLDDQRYGLDLSCVMRIVRAVEVTQLPEAPPTILGVVNVEGDVIPVVNSRRRLSMPERELELADHFIIVKGPEASLALVADKVDPVAEVPEDCLVSSDTVVPNAGCVQAVAKMEEGMIVILDVQTMLLPEELESIDISAEEMGSEDND